MPNPVQGYDVEAAHSALYAINPACDRETWVRIGMAAQDAGLDFDAFNDWSAQAGNYSEQDARTTWRSIKPGGGVGAGTLFKIATENGWNTSCDKRHIQTKPRLAEVPRKPPASPIEAPVKPRPGMSAIEVWERCEAATSAHGYIMSKGAIGVPLDNLRVVPVADKLTIAGQSMAGYLAVPAFADGAIQSIQFVPPPGVGKKLNLPGASMAGASFTVGTLVPGAVVYITEGIGAAWSCWQATGAVSVSCFGAGNMRRVAAELRGRDAAARLVIVADVGKEHQAEVIAKEVGGRVVTMPEGWPENSDVNDLALRDGCDALGMRLEAAVELPKPEPRYKLLNRDDLAALPALAWRVRGVLPAVGLAGLYGPSGGGKSFLAFDLVAAIADGRRWFDCRVEAAPVVYCALEGEAGFKLRAQAWEAQMGCNLPDGMRMMLQPFRLTEPSDVEDLAAVVPEGAVVVIDTLNRAAPTSNENESAGMGEILQAAKHLQTLTSGLVILVHHSGKDATKGLRGHSSLFAAMDACIEVARDGDRREWRVSKSKDGGDGDTHQFRLQIETLGIDAYGDPVTSCTVRADSVSSDVRTVKVPQGGNQRLVYEGIRALFKDGVTGKPGAPPLRPCIELEAAVMAGAARLSCISDKKTSRARDAITGLVSRGVLGLNEGFLWTV